MNNQTFSLQYLGLNFEKKKKQVARFSEASETTGFSPCLTSAFNMAALCGKV